MIKKIEMSQVASYKAPTILDTDKKVNLVYGLNGSGKSTISNFLYDATLPQFEKCSFEKGNNEEILVYNQQFIRDYFYESENLKGIFTLSKENRDAEEIIRKAEIENSKLQNDIESFSNSIKQLNEDIEQAKRNSENKTWEIKAQFSGGDRVLEYCLSGMMGRKEALFNHINSIPKPSMAPPKTIEQLKKEVEAIQGSSAQKFSILPIIEIDLNDIESDTIWGKVVIGSDNSSVSSLIKVLGNSDWVRKGLEYLPGEIMGESTSCPFCQEKTITKALVENIKAYFDKAYERDLDHLKNRFSSYKRSFESLPSISQFEKNPILLEKKPDFLALYEKVQMNLSQNLSLIGEKIKTPSQSVTLIGTNDCIGALNMFIKTINALIIEHNSKIDNKEAALEAIKGSFWELMRWDYDQTLFAYQTQKSDLEKRKNEFNEKLEKAGEKAKAQKLIILEHQKKTVNIDEAVSNINSGLVELGIDGFRIEKHTDILYKIVRGEKCENTFQTLSEGEKMIISFLYFRELIRGKKTSGSENKKKVIVIDDPISSLSHIYVFNIGHMIKKEFSNSPNCEQLFVLTHSLYFFYELTDIKKERREQTQKLFRIVKGSDGSKISEMKYEEIQNDYQAYWHVVNDDKQPPALIANCMRNIIEYFFNFIEKKDLNNVFQKASLQETRYQAFYRYVNRESHSIGQNIFDYKEFDYRDFKDALKLVFTENGYPEHYEKMAGKPIL